MPTPRLALFALLAGLLAPAAAFAASLEEQVKDAYAAWDAAFNKGDPEAIAAFYADDAVFLPPTHEVIKGPAGWMMRAASTCSALGKRTWGELAHPAPWQSPWPRARSLSPGVVGAPWSGPSPAPGGGSRSRPWMAPARPPEPRQATILMARVPALRRGLSSAS